jgi:Histidine-specific methyltransferase, SAM-dependent
MMTSEASPLSSISIFSPASIANLEAIFTLEAFAHEARWNERESSIEMHLVSLMSQVVSVAGMSFTFAQGDTIHTETCRKFDVAGFALAAPGQDGGWISFGATQLRFSQSSVSARLCESWLKGGSPFRRRPLISRNARVAYDSA